MINAVPVLDMTGKLDLEQPGLTVERTFITVKPV
jgi:hypothetical protein